MFYRISPVLAVCSALLLSGCLATGGSDVITGPTLTEQQWNEQRTRLVDADNYLIRGTLDLNLLPRHTYAGNTSTRGSASFVYSRDGLNYVFVVTHHLAGVLLKIRRSEAAGVELTDADGVKHTFRSEKECLDTVRIPTGRLPYWMMGILLGDESASRRDQEGRLAMAESAGWRISYFEYGLFGSYVLPRRMKLENSDVGTIMVATDSWEFAK